MTSESPKAPPSPTPMRPATIAVTAGRPPHEPGRPLSPPVELSSTYYAADDATEPGLPLYGRFGNRSWHDLEDVIGQLEGGVTTLFGSGMAAIAAVFEQVPVGGRLVIPRNPYSNTSVLARKLAEDGRFQLDEVDITDTAAVLASVARGAQVVFIESPTNPLLDVADLPALVVAAKDAGALLAVDNTFATPLLQRPLSVGADIVVHSATKYLAGHSDVVLGAVVTQPGAAEVLADIRWQRSLRGAIPGPFECWLALRGLRTLELRVHRAGQNAAELAQRLQGHPALTRVRHPSLPEDPSHERATAQLSGFGAIIAIEVRGGAAAAERVCSATRIWAHSTSLGGVESQLERRRRHAAESHDVPEALIRLSTGIEDVEDLWDDLSQALEKAY